MKSLRRTRLRTGICEVDGDLFERSRLARAGRSLVHLAVFIRAIEPALALVAVLLVVAIPALAHTPGPPRCGTPQGLESLRLACPEEAANCNRSCVHVRWPQGA